MNKQAYDQGFIDACNANGVDPQALVKVAQLGKILELAGKGSKAVGGLASKGGKAISELGGKITKLNPLRRFKPFNRANELVNKTNNARSEAAVALKKFRGGRGALAKAKMRDWNIDIANSYKGLENQNFDLFEPNLYRRARSGFNNRYTHARYLRGVARRAAGREGKYDRYLNWISGTPSGTAALGAGIGGAVYGGYRLAQK